MTSPSGPQLWWVETRSARVGFVACVGGSLRRSESVGPRKAFVHPVRAWSRACAEVVIFVPGPALDSDDWQELQFENRSLVGAEPRRVVVDGPAVVVMC